MSDVKEYTILTQFLALYISLLLQQHHQVTVNSNDKFLNHTFFYLAYNAFQTLRVAPGGLRAPHVVHSQAKLAIVNGYFLSSSSVHCISPTSGVLSKLNFGILP